MFKTNANDGKDVLLPREILTGEEPRRLTFHVPISYDLLQGTAVDGRIGKLDLLVDGRRVSGATRAADGTCLLIWDTAYNPPGEHAIQVQCTIGGRSGTRAVTATGPSISARSTNVLQFDMFDSLFSDSRGAFLRAKLAITNANYKIDLYSASWEHIKTIAGSVSNSTITEHWNLIDQAGETYTNASITAVFQIFFDSRSESQTQTLTRAFP
jgi:hypothetical protein